MIGIKDGVNPTFLCTKIHNEDICDVRLNEGEYPTFDLIKARDYTKAMQ